MSQIEVTKAVGYAWLSPPPDRIVVAKVVAYLWVTPGGGEVNTGQGHTYGKIVRRLRS